MKLPFGGEDILKPVPTPNVPNPKPGTPEHDHALARAKSSRSIAAMPWLPQDPSDEWAKELYERIEEAERTYAAPNLRYEDYIEGTAQEPDEIAIVRGEGIQDPYLFSAEHATCPIKVSTGEYRSPDAGTGGLAAVMAKDYGTALIMRGRQTTNVPSVEDHPIKPLIRQELATAIGFMSVHGQYPRKFLHQSDRVEVQACIGLGVEPTENMREFARKIVRAARDDLGLYVVISNDQPVYIQQRHGTRLKRLEDGSPKLSRLAALNPKMTTNFSRDSLREMGRDIPSMQMELTNLLLLTTLEGVRKDKKTRIIGVALGYKLLEKVVQLTFSESGL